MGFGQQFERYRLPEWAAHYLDYFLLKDVIKSMRMKRLSTSISPGSVSLLSKNRSMLMEPLVSQSSYSESIEDVIAEELLKVSKFYTLRRQDLEASISSIFTHIHTAKEKLVTRSGSVDLRNRLPSLWRAIHQVHWNLWCLEVFCEVDDGECEKNNDRGRSGGHALGH